MARMPVRRRVRDIEPVEQPHARTLLGMTQDEWLAHRNMHKRKLDESTHFGDEDSIESGLHDMSVCEHVLGLSFWKEQT